MRVFRNVNLSRLCGNVQIKVALLAAMLMVSTQVQAQQKEKAQDAANESSDHLEIVIAGGLLVPGGGITNFGDSLGAKSGGSAGVQLGVFVTPEITVRFDFTYGRLGIDNGNLANAKHQYFNAMLYGKYFFFSESKLTPFVRMMAGIHAPKFTTVVFNANESRYRLREQSYAPAPAVGAAVGLLALTSDNGGIFLEAGYQLSFSSKVSGKFQDTDYVLGENGGLLSLRAGFNLFFGS